MPRPQTYRGIGIHGGPAVKIPKLCHHKGQERGYVTVGGKESYFDGHWPREHQRPPQVILAQYEAFRLRYLECVPAERPKPVKCPSVGEVWEQYWVHATGYYVKHGKPTSEVACIKMAGRVLARLYGDLDAARFGVNELDEVRSEFVRSGWCRKTVNEGVNRVRRMFKWAALRKLVPVAVLHELQLLPPLKKGRTTARETPPVKPVEWSLVEATLPHLHPILRAMVQTHYLLGCRSQDVCPMRAGELDRTGPVWLYRPASWKTEHHEGQAPLVYWVGPKAQAVLLPLLEACAGPESYVFSTRSVYGNGPHRRGCYSTATYRTGIKRVLQKHGLPHWYPYRLRHTRLTEIGDRYGVEAAQTVAMHQELSTTRLYAEKNLARSREIMGEIG